MAGWRSGDSMLGMLLGVLRIALFSAAIMGRCIHVPNLSDAMQFLATDDMSVQTHMRSEFTH
jgi:hypothetical protein